MAARNVASKTASIIARPVVSRNADEAKIAVLQVYKNLQRITPKFWWDFGLHDMPLGVFRAVLKQQFTANAAIKDIRVIDRKVYETYKHIEAITMTYYNPVHVRNYLFKENVEAPPTDFLGKFLAGK